MEINISGNRAQLPKLLLQAHTEVSVEGRGTGKSFDIGFKMDQIVRQMPGAVVALTGKTFGQLLTRTLPSSLKLLEQMGYQKDVNYVIGRRPPSWFRPSIEVLNKFDNVISFSNGTRFAMISQSEPGSGRGANVDYEIVDEALLINREQYNNEVSPTNRGNLEFFSRGQKKVSMHHGAKYSTSMPVSKEGRWVLEYADYYLRERGIRIFDLWNRIVAQQMELLNTAEQYRDPNNSGCTRQDLRRQFTLQWNEISRLRQQMCPFVSKEGVLFTLSNAFDNLNLLGIDYILQNRRRLPHLVFMIEIMNLYYDKVDDGFYSLQENRHVYYNFYDTDRLLNQAQRTGFHLLDQAAQSSLIDRDCDPTAPLEIAFDWGSSISLMVVMQERHWDFNQQMATSTPCQTQINEFFVKPDGGSNIMIQDLISQFTAHYQHHSCRELHYYKDRYGDHRNPAAINAATYNQIAISLLQAAGWSVETHQHPGIEPPQSDKYLLWGLILAEQDDSLPRFRINGDRCRYTLISMNNARVKNHDGRLSKDKSSERPTSGVLPEEATHFSDAVDKLIWTKWGQRLQGDPAPAVIRFGTLR